MLCVLLLMAKSYSFVCSFLAGVNPGDGWLTLINQARTDHAVDVLSICQHIVAIRRTSRERERIVSERHS